MARYSFSGHETFTCKSLWLKKGFDFLEAGHSFTDDDAVVPLGVGKNMVTSIRFWMKSYGMTERDKLTPLAKYILADEGYDPYVEDINTLWLLHYHLVKNQMASLYALLFLEWQRDSKTFSREQLLNFVKRKCSAPEQKNVYNENTVKKDIGVLLANYVMPSTKKSFEEYNALMLDLGMIKAVEDKNYAFSQTRSDMISPDVILYTLLDYCEGEKTISFDKLQEIALIFCMPLVELIITLRQLAADYKDQMDFTDNAGVRNVQWIGEPLDKWEILKTIYRK